MVTMSQKSSVPQAVKSVSQVLMPDSAPLHVGFGPTTDSRLRRCRFWFGGFWHLNEENDEGHEGGGA
jgi:hypothetical protein